MTSSLHLWSLIDSRLPTIEVANSHWGLSARRSSGTYWLACSMRRTSASGQLAAAQQKVVTDHVIGFVLNQPLVLSRLQFYLKGGNDLLVNVVLHRKNVFEIMVVAFGPKMSAACPIDQLGGDPNAITGFAHTSFKYVPHAERVTSLTYSSEAEFIG